MDLRIIDNSVAVSTPGVEEKPFAISDLDRMFFYLIRIRKVVQ